MAIVNVKTFDDYILQAEVLTGLYDWNGSTSTVLIGATDTETGEFNSQLISASQGASSGSANDVCLTHVSGGFNDWYLPSNDELSLCRLAGVLTHPFYWSSTEANTNSAYIIVTSTGTITDNLKGFGTFNVVAVRKEYISDVITIERMNLLSSQAPILNGGVNNADEDVYKMLGGINGISKNSKILINE